MPKLDIIHNAVRNALIKDGWVITDDPYVIQLILNKHQFPLIVVDIEMEAIRQWIN
jgi:hypothetical protein